jgi:hypothetical protein
LTPDPLTRPIFVVAPPRAGGRSVGQILATGPDCWTAGSAPDALLAPVRELDPPDGSRSGRLTASDCTPAVRQSLRGHLQVQFARRDRPAADRRDTKIPMPRLVHAAPRNALVVPFLDTAFPDATFVYVHRRPVDALAESLLLWRAGTAITYPDLPGWQGPPWSLLLVPDWQELAGRPLPEIVTEQWVRTMRALTGDLEQLGPDRWCVVRYGALQREPRETVTRLLRYLGLESAEAGPAPPRTRPAPADLTAARAELEPYLDRTRELAERAADWLAEARR